MGKIEEGNRLIEYEEDINGCWICVSHKPKRKDGYYQITTGSRKDNSRKNTLLHRYIYEMFNDIIDDSLVVRHKCDNGFCINPNHLELGTHQDNMNDMKTRGRSTKGERNASSKLTEEQVKEIRRLYSDREYNQKELSSLFDVSQRHISNIVRNISWT